MTSTVFAFVERIAVYIAGIAATLATVSGCVAAVERGTETFGAIPVALGGMFMLGGCIVTAATMHARATTPKGVAPVDDPAP